MDNPIEILYFSSALFDRQAQINKLNEDNSYLIKLNDKYTVRMAFLLVLIKKNILKIE